MIQWFNADSQTRETLDRLDTTYDVPSVVVGQSICRQSGRSRLVSLHPPDQTVVEPTQYTWCNALYRDIFAQ